MLNSLGDTNSAVLLNIEFLDVIQDKSESRMDNTIRVIFLNLSLEDDKFSEERKNILIQLKAQRNITLQEPLSIDDAKQRLKEHLTDISVLIVWVDHGNVDEWHNLDDFMEEEEEIYYVGFIVIFGFKEKNVFEHANKALRRKVYTLGCPVNFSVLNAFIDALESDMREQKSLDKFREKLLSQKSSNNIIIETFNYLTALIGYERATISLVDRKSKTGKRYLLKVHDPKASWHRVQKLQKDIQGDKAFFISLCKWYLSILIRQPIQDKSLHFQVNKLLVQVAGDKLIEKVNKKTICIIEDLDELLKNPKSLSDWGWTDEDTTKDIKSWIGFAAKCQNRTVAIITLDRATTDQKYEKFNHKNKKLLRNIGEIFANAIEDFLLERNRRIVKDIISEMGDDLTNKELIRQVLVKLNSELGCERGNCTYFSVSYDLKENEYFLSEFASAKDEPYVTKKSQKQTELKEQNEENNNHPYKKGRGIVGAVLQEGKSRLVPHAFEDEMFIPTLKHPGDNVSMLAVPVIPNSNEPKRIIGVISCYVEELDYFTVYDRDLVEDVALSIATVIERTMTLEFLNGISSKMAEFVVDSDIEKVLKSICEYALKVTSAGSASIHLLQYLGNSSDKEVNNDNDKKEIFSFPISVQQGLCNLKNLDVEDSRNYRATGDYYTSPPDTEDSPRLKGKGTTNVAIRMNKTVEFSAKNGKLHLINTEQNHLNNPTVVPFAPGQENKGVQYKIIVPLKSSDEKQGFIGALYLNKYSNEAFSEIEKFALELFAKQAALIIKNQHIISKNFFWAEAHKNFKSAIETIARRDDISLLLQDVAQYSYSLLRKDLDYLTSRNAERDPGGKKTEGHVPTLTDLVSYVVISNDRGKRKVEAAWPISELIDLKNRYCDGKKKGITGLAAELQKPVIVNDIREDRRDKNEKATEYIEFKKETLSQLSVPILYDEVNSGDNRVIGVINLEYSLPYAFQDSHRVEVIKHFARQVAIAFQKKNLLDQISGNNKILTSLHQSLSNIMSESPQNILYKAVSQTREALEAKEVIVVLFENEPPEIIPPRDNNLMKVLLKPSKKLYDIDGDECIVYTSIPVKNSENSSKQIKVEPLDFSSKDFSYGFCLPFSSGSTKMGVMWIIFSKDCHKENLERDYEVYKVYVNQIALAYENANRFEQFKKKENDDLVNAITEDSKELRTQASRLYWTSLFFSVLCCFLILGGISYQVVKSDSRNSLNAGGFVAIAGVILNAVTVLAFNREKEANNRVDQYHREIYNVGKLRILLSATEQLIDPETVKEEKRKIIQAAINPWLQPINEPNSDDEISKLNKAEKMDN